MGYRRELIHHLMATDFGLVEGDFTNLSEHELGSALPPGLTPEKFVSHLKQGSWVLLTENPSEHALIRKSGANAVGWSLNPQTADNFAEEAQQALLTRTKQIEARYRAFYSRPEEQAVPVQYTPEPVKDDDNLTFSWKIYIRGPLSFASDKHAFLNQKIPYALKDNNSEMERNGEVPHFIINPSLTSSTNDYSLTLFPESAEESTAKPSSQSYQGEPNRLLMTSDSAHIHPGNTTLPDYDTTYACMDLVYPSVEGAIVYPALTSPLLFHPQQDAPLRILLALESALDKDATPAYLTRIVHEQLCVAPMQAISEVPGAPLYRQHSVMQKYMKVNLLGELTGKRQAVRDHEDRPWCIIRDSSAKAYREANLTQLVEVTIDPKGIALSEGLYDLAWISLTKHGKEEYQTHAHGKTSESCMEDLYHEQQDANLASWLSSVECCKTTAYPFEQWNDLDRERLAKQDGLKSSPDLGICQRHPLYIKSKNTLNPGQLSDVHISSRQHVFLRSKAQVIPGADVKDSPYIGETLNVSLLAFRDLLKQMGEHPEIDILVITGDLIDYCSNLDPEKSDAKNTGGIWRDADHKNYANTTGLYGSIATGGGIDNSKVNESLYSKFIDDVMAYGLLEHFLVTYKKPVILVSGNHEAYDVPYGISPRVAGGMMKANEGIPADHNLTIYEACLMYGPDYGAVVNSFNFTKENFAWFYQVFSPVTDMVITFNKQCFVGLEWGDGEDFLGSKAAGGGALPRATESCDALQLELLYEGSRLHKEHGYLNLLLTHFTLVNFPTSSLLNERWKINCSDASTLWAKQSGDRDNGEEGSFYCGRKEVYTEAVLNNHYQYCLAGHSHRAGLYYMCDTNHRPPTDTSHVEPVYWPSPEDTKILNQDKIIVEATGVIPGQLQPRDIEGMTKDKTRIIVAGSGGPVSKQNFDGEMDGYGMSPPQGLWIDIAKDEVHLIKCNLPQAQPRFAVAADSMSTLGGKKFIQRFSSKGGRWELELHPDFPQEVIVDIKLHVTKKSTLKYIISSSIGFGLAKGLCGEVLNDFLTNNKVLKNYKKYHYHLSIHFNVTLSKVEKYKDYCFDTPWCFPVDLIKPQKEHAQCVGDDDYIVLANSLTPDWMILIGDEEPGSEMYKYFSDIMGEYC